jgi:UDP-N-acetylglucosamine acyltransferase
VSPVAKIHPTAVVDPGAKLADDVELGPYTIVGNGVRLDAGVKVASHVIIVGHTGIGSGTRIFPFCVIGEEPQVQGVEGETSLHIGQNNIIREYASIHAGSSIGVGCTRVGDNNFILNNVHVAHDCQVGSNTIIASFSAMAGHVVMEDYAVLGAMVGVHQFVRIGENAFVGANTKLSKDVAPFSKVAGGDHARFAGVNGIGMKRRGFSDEKVAELKHAFHLLYQSKLRLAPAMERVERELSGSREVAQLLHFLRTSTRGVTR